mgnify:CR=1 FL=1
MTQAFRDALGALDILQGRFPLGGTAIVPSGARHTAIGPALHSETLECLIVVVRHDGLLVATRPANTYPAGAGPTDATRAQDALAPGHAVRHAKGGIYTRYGTVRTPEGPHVLYLCHAKGILWLRPKAHFETPGRFVDAPHDAPMIPA